MRFQSRNKQKLTRVCIESDFRAINTLLLSLLCMAIITGLVKFVSAKEPVSEILFFRFAGSLVLLSFVLRRSGGVSLLRTTQPLQHFVRTVCGMLSIGLYFLSIRSIPIADATAISFSAPLFVLVFAVPLLGEQVSIRQWFMVFLGFCGMLLIASPTGHHFGIGSIAAIGSAVFGAMVSIWLRRLSFRESVITIAVLYNTTGTLILLCWLLVTDWTLNWDVYLLAMICIGLLGGVQQYTLTTAYRLTRASVLAPIEYLLLILVGLIGWYFWSEVPSINGLFGAFIVVVSSIFATRYARKKPNM